MKSQKWIRIKNTLIDMSIMTHVFTAKLHRFDETEFMIGSENADDKYEWFFDSEEEMMQAFETICKALE